MSKKIIFSSFTILIILALTIGIIAYGRGYRFSWQTGKIEPTGLLLAKSYPDGAQVFVDDHLVSATNNTITLPPGEYEVKIVKDGYFPWQKKLIIQGEVVTRAEALLLPTAPELKPLTSTGAINPTLSLDGNRLVYGIATASAEKQGVWINDLTNQPLKFQPSALQIYRDNEYLKLSQAKFYWSPDNKKILAVSGDNYYLLNADNLNSIPQDVTLTSDLIIAQWLEEHLLKKELLLKTLKTPLYNFIKNNTRVISWAPDETKLLYEATNSAVLETILKPPLIGTNNQPEQRNVSPGKIYVYDLREDKNFFIKESEKNNLSLEEKEENLLSKYQKEINSSSLLWLSDSNHLIWIETNEENNRWIEISEYDNTNKATVFAAPFENHYVFPFPSGNRIIILTTLNPQITIPNLYIIDLK